MEDAELQMAAKVLRAMGNPIRLGVIDRLRDGPRTVGELCRELGCSQSMMSQQIQTLEYHGLVASRKEGTQKYCSLSNRDVLAMIECLRRHLHDFLSGGGIGPMATNQNRNETK